MQLGVLSCWRRSRHGRADPSDERRPLHFVALTLLRERDAVSQHDLAGALHMDRTNLVGLLNELEERRLIARRRVPEDRRRHIVDLIDKGARARRR